MISADYDGLICAAFLHQHLNWRLSGYYDLENLWISAFAEQNNKDLIWVDLNILPVQGKAVGGHIINYGEGNPKGFKSSCNPNILAGISADSFDKKFPLSTVLFLFWLYKNPLPTEFKALALLLHADAGWLKIQSYPENCRSWFEILANYDWQIAFKKSLSKTFERRMDQIIYPLLADLGALSGKSKLSGKNLGVKSRQFQFNPDWDEDVMLDLLTLFANVFKWTPPKLPKIIRRIEGQRKKINLREVKKLGLKPFLKKNKVFSYAISSPEIFNYTSFGTDRKSPMGTA